MIIKHIKQGLRSQNTEGMYYLGDTARFPLWHHSFLRHMGLIT